MFENFGSFLTHNWLQTTAYTRIVWESVMWCFLFGDLIFLCAKDPDTGVEVSTEKSDDGKLKQVDKHYYWALSQALPCRLFILELTVYFDS